MPKRRSKYQVRRCGRCNLVGHNLATCKAALSEPQTPILPLPIEAVSSARRRYYRKPDNATTKASVPPFSSSKKSHPPMPVKFFIHHVTNDSQLSPYHVDLKSQHYRAWDAIGSVAPEPTTISRQPHQPVAQPEAVTLEKLFKAAPAALASDIENVPTKKPSPHESALFKNVTASIHTYLADAFAWLNFWKYLKRHSVAIVATLILLLVAPGPLLAYWADLMATKNTVTTSGLAGFAALKRSTSALFSANVAEAAAASDEAVVNFSKALTALDEKHRFLQTLISALPVVNKSFTSRAELLLAGQEIALGNTYLLKEINHTALNSNLPWLRRLEDLTHIVDTARPYYEQALIHLQNVDVKTLPANDQGTLTQYRNWFTVTVSDLRHLSDLGRALPDIFGRKGLKRYLLIFQNPYELRATGGFMGSFAVLELQDSRMVKLDVAPGGTYDLQGQLAEYVKPPTPLLLANKRWEFQDANWFPDFPASAQKILWFYSHARGATADGVIAINSTVLQRLLSITGPITDSTREITLSADTALASLQTTIETGPEKQAHKPKQILADLAPKLLDTLLNQPASNHLELLSNLTEALSQKEIQAYFVDHVTESRVRALGWAGEITATTSDQDYLMVINTNVQGQKSDANMQQAISHQAVVQADGSVFDTVTITRTHTGAPDQSLYGQTNIDYLRLYVPAGSQLMAAKGFTWPEDRVFKVPDPESKPDAMLQQLEHEVATDATSGTRVTSEFGKTSFGNWVITEPGKTNVVQFTYRLPTTVNLNHQQLTNYQLVVDRQSGAESSLESQIIFPDNWQPVWGLGDRLELAKNGAHLKPGDLTKNGLWNVLLKKLN